MSTETESPKKLSLVIFSGSFEKVHYALVMASAALATGREVTLFFTMDASRALLAPSGWRHLRTEAEGATATSIDLSFSTRGIGSFEELLSACASLGAKFMVCEMGLRALGLENEATRDELSIETGGVVTFLNDARQNGEMLFI
ncbi:MULTISPECIES: DsrE/DsrF/DrsH-like family protein [unclassified Thalassospira]|uniref:DsrE/DsrF/DrsH-like family protein n=1 Tax=Thalassospira TaxID=168934 RepID=UPI001B0839DC|nr:DsrE/DsrF/DrsH-like family protein [Thalassospira sp.]MBO6770459.1 DsrE/DsrF/DrsH-like family protein [Thalassospira sp.]|tara:strand:- start:806 stop:1237 length:432 start_codon:yes stop_codon:yes gene_type:complete|eukprot:NODE_2813_length_987_cov_1.502326_g2793_i0.p2 GENE.NODE_2813_length_987_cov_1.502326_g2793_i0~~NODE_2813_length_987_cov_1.502326_g2793_i0.p2  ORF type:complete len:144 (-),score=19.19 NODE_2813_length_987_cov_1.502326_g2793_i0:287-718(-)